MRTGEFILLDIPNHESVQASVRMVQENAGENLLGLCIFRLPGASDKTNLSLNEMVCALKDEAPVPQIDVDIAAEKTLPKSISHLTITITNSGAVSSLLGEDAMTLDVGLPVGSLRAVTTDQSLAADPFFNSHPCTERRANLLKIKTPGLAVGASGQVVIEIEGDLPDSLQTVISLQTVDAQEWRDERTISIKR